ncbi:type II toxin-antitoxin system VapC family toxin [Methylosinus sp. H3A]|uniref:type II toxin-antitoxin system VapC family toxin n=1 Tax=Methylosinus sp. H3A TaxID=2785786 RepID=UPI0018C32358|nr:type II toxin-antitoxin system VapC family toxin [Methylosinus sp. H3A]MBG0810980.1 type II toxin-antitoxin system VapC family toxin [Methylosinus sp. H3A]
MVIIDASVAVKWYVAEAQHMQAREILAAANDLLAAPDLILTEVANALRRKVSEGTATREQALEALEDLPRSFSLLVPSSATLRAAFDIALDLGHPFPDCVYLACAAMNDARLVTDDRKFLEKAVANGHKSRIVLLAEWKPRGPRGEIAS